MTHASTESYPTAHRITAAALTLMLSLAVGVFTGAPSAQAATGDLTISDAWMRFILPARPAAGYFTLTNNGDKERDLVGASSPACGELMLHQSMNMNGVESMHMVESVTVPAHGSIEFAPGGNHLMCMMPSSDMKVGASVPVTLEFKNGDALTAQFSVRGATGQ